MATPIMTGDPVLQRLLKDKYWAYRDQGLTRREAHSAAFQDVQEAHEDGYVLEEDLNMEPEEEIIENPYAKPIYDDSGPL